ncbi:inorganic phosphate transporter [Salinigranum halophilum]|uniref:inorganic phosphate transporter n=1 Tax=Salinigranum halophilum TaxID=2565931 RepID=UPI0010A9491E|nr:inorganic phosphate transporter [Salinigranum halophilum]
MISLLLLVGLAVAVFVGFNVGGSNTGVAFGPAVGSGAVSKLAAGLLMTVFALLGGWTVGRRVVTTLGSNLVVGDPFTLPVSIGVLFFIGGSLFVSNVFGVPASTSMTAVGAIAGLGLAQNALATAVVLEIISWWIVAPLIAFWVSGMVGRYAYDAIEERIAVDTSDGSLLALDTDGRIPTPQLADETTPREATGVVLVVGIACFMAFSAGASNVANAIAPLVGSGQLTMNAGILLASGAIGLGAVTIARRTLDTMGEGLTELPLTAALVVAVVSATLVTALSAIGIPASFVVIATMSTVGLGWGRATRAEGALVVDADDVVEELEQEVSVGDLYRPWATLRVVALQNAVPAVATIGAYALFSVW